MVTTTFDGEQEIPIGAPVFTTDGERVGYVLGGDAYQLFIGEGFLFRHNYAVDLADIEPSRDEHLVLKLTKAQFEERLRD